MCQPWGRGSCPLEPGREAPASLARQESSNQTHQQGDERGPRRPQGLILEMVVLKVHVCWGEKCHNPVRLGQPQITELSALSSCSARTDLQPQGTVILAPR